MTHRQTGPIFIVDDNDEAADLFASLLRYRKYDVHVFYSARSALPSVFELRPVVVISDIGMPEIDGFEFARSIRMKSPGYYPILIAVSGRSDASWAEKAFQSGFDFHFPKPVSHAGMLKLLSLTLGIAPADPSGQGSAP